MDLNFASDHGSAAMCSRVNLLELGISCENDDNEDFQNMRGY